MWADVGEVAQYFWIEALEVLQVVQQCQAAALVINVIEQHRQWPADVVQMLDQSVPRHLSMGFFTGEARGDGLLLVGMSLGGLTSIALARPGGFRAWPVRVPGRDVTGLGEERGSNVYRSIDQGKTFERIGQVRIDRRGCFGARGRPG